MVAKELCEAIKSVVTGINLFVVQQAMDENLFSEVIESYQEQMKENEQVIIEMLGKELTQAIKEFKVMTTKEQNILIAEFMGEKRFNHPEIVFDIPKHIRENETSEKGGTLYGCNQLRYHTSWDWLMPVVEKIINETQSVVSLSAPGHTSMQYEWETHLCYDQTNGVCSEGKTLLESTYESVFKYLEKKNS